MSSLGKEMTDLHLSLDCGDNAVKTHTPHIQPECVGPIQITEDVTSDTLNFSRRNLKYVVDCILKDTNLKVGQADYSDAIIFKNMLCYSELTVSSLTILLLF